MEKITRDGINYFTVPEIPNVECKRNMSQVWHEIWQREGFREWTTGKTFKKVMSCRMRCVYEAKPELKEVRSQEAKEQWSDPEMKKKIRAAMVKGQLRRWKKYKERNAAKRINDYSGRITQSEFQELSL